MIVDSLILVALPSFPAQCVFESSFPPRRLRNRAVCCSRGNGELSGLRLTSQRMELEGQNNREMSKSTKGEAEVESEIWRLFKEAQQNILEMNKQRLIAIEKLKRVVNEKNLLQEKVEKLETEKQAAVGKDQISICSEMLLRIDSMVLTGMIDTRDASEMRRLVMDHRVSIADAFVDILQKNDAVLLAELRQFSDKGKKNGFHIIHISTEMAPLTSFGAVASYVTGLSRALQRKGNLVEVILPKYATLDLNEVQQLREIEVEYYSYFNGQLHGNRIWTGVVHGVGVTLIQPLYYSSFFNRERRNGYADDFERFTYFSRASLDYIVKSGKQPDVLHIHNWETAIVGPLFWELFVMQGLGGTRIMLTCHDYHSQHLDEPEKLALCGLDPGRLHRPDRLQDNTKTHLVNILKGGIVYSNKVMVMSLNHSKGRNIHGLVHGLESTFSTHKEKLVASSHALDCYSWDPAKDSFLPENYSIEDMKGKTACKVALQQILGIAENSSMIMVGCILLDVTDVDVENMRSVVLNAIGGEVQLVVMGPGKTMAVDRILKSFLEEVQNQNVTFLDSYDEVLSHLIFAGSDIFLCQSFYDPVLQLPLKALKYGALPIEITCSDCRFSRHYADNDYETTDYGRFIISSFGNLTLSQALDEINNDAPKWRAKVIDAMAKDFSWDAECYDVHLSAYAAVKKL